MKDYLKNLELFERSKVIPLVIGSSGWGKSDGVRLYAKETNRPCLEYYASMIGAEDIGGFPFIVDGVLYRANDSALESALNGPVVLFFDEINQARPDVINAMFSILRERKVNGRDLDPNTFIVCAGNELDDNPYLTDLPPAFKNRTEFCPPPKSWADAELYLSNKYNLSSLRVREVRKISEVSNPARLERLLRLIINNVSVSLLSSILGSEMIAKQLLEKNSTKGVSSVYEKISLASAYAQTPIYGDNFTRYPSAEEVMTKFNLTKEELKLVKLKA